MRRGAAVLAAAALGIASATEIAPFSGSAPGSAPPPWKAMGVANLKMPEFSVVDDEGRSVLRAHAASAAGSLAHRLEADVAARPILTWRWKVDRVIEKADLTRKEGDDYAARVYVAFDVPLEHLSFAQRVRMRLAKLIYGADLPTAALCYVWDNRNPVGTTAWNPYSDRMRMVVLRSGEGQTGQWVAEARDVAADFRAAFPEWRGPLPKVMGVAVAADTDQTAESVTAWFGDLRFEARR